MVSAHDVAGSCDDESCVGCVSFCFEGFCCFHLRDFGHEVVAVDGGVVVVDVVGVVDHGVGECEERVWFGGGESE